MTELRIPHGAMTLFQGSPQLVGTNDGTPLTDDSDATYLTLTTGPPGDQFRADRARCFLADPGTDISAATAIRLVMRASCPVDQTLVWNLEGWGDDWWTVGGQWNVPGDGIPHVLDYTIDGADPDLYIDGPAFSSGYDPTKIARDIPLGQAEVDWQNNGIPGGSTITVYEFQVFVTPDAPAPIADFTWELDESGRMVHFDGTSSTSSVPIDFWLWDFADTVRIPIDQPNDVPVLDHQFFALGPFEVTLTITAGGETVGVTKTVDLSPNAISGDYDNDRPAFSGAWV